MSWQIPTNRLSSHFPPRRRCPDRKRPGQLHRALPRSPSSQLRCSPPTPRFPSVANSGLPLLPAYRGADACSVPFGRRFVLPRTSRALEILVRLPVFAAFPEEKPGPPRFLGRPLLACRVRTPRRMRPALADFFRSDRFRLQEKQHPGIRNRHNFRGRIPTALACLRIAGRLAASVARLAPGWGDYPLRRAGFAPAGRLTEFHEFIAFPHSFRTSLYWSRYSTYVPTRASRRSGEISVWPTKPSLVSMTHTPRASRLPARGL